MDRVSGRLFRHGGAAGAGCRQADRKTVRQERREKAGIGQAAARESDQAHRRAIMGEAKSAIMGCGTDEDTARKIVLAIVAGQVPHTKLEF